MPEGRGPLNEAKRLLLVQQAIAGHIAGARSRAELLERVVATIGESLEWSFGAGWELASDDRLHCRATWQRPGAGMDWFMRETLARHFPHGEGLPGRTWARGEPVWIPDLGREAAAQGRSVAPAAGVASAVAFPVRIGERFDGVLEFFGEEIREPDTELLAMFATVGGHLAQALERWGAIGALADSEELNRSVVAALEEGLLVFADDMRIVSANAAAARILGIPHEGILGRSPAEILESGFEVLDADDMPVDPEANAVTKTLQTGEPQRDVALGLTRPDGSRALLSLNVQPLRRPGQPRPHGVVCSLADITQRRIGELALRDERDRAQSYLDVTTTMIVVLDARARVELINPKCLEVFGRAEHEVVGRDWFELAVPEEERVRTREAFDRLIAGEVELAEFFENQIVTAEGRERTIAWHNAVVRDSAGRVTGTISSGEDVTERRAAEREIAHLAFHDHLTGLPNRTLLEEHLAIALARAARRTHSVAMLFLDLDDFKRVNDSLGHAAGDALLQEVATRLGAVTRASDLLARQGGDEFLLLLTDLGDDPAGEACRVAGKLERALERPFQLGGREFQIDASIGLSLFPHDAPTADALMRHADAAMYQAKSAGRARMVLHAGDDQHRPTSSTIERLADPERLRHAIEHDELVLHYQPVVRLADGGVFGVEALVRWQDPERGLIFPLRFIPQAEASGLITALGDWVIEAALRQAAGWARDGLSASVSFNLSPRQLRPGLAGKVGEQLQQTGVDPRLVSIEITESAAMLEAGAGAPLLRDLAALGIRLAVDDFGAGYSSLARLRTLPVEILKIDRSFVLAVPEDSGARAMLASIVRMAGALGKVPIAEGVETGEQHQFLRDLGCPLAQGNLLSRPLPEGEATEYLRAERGAARV